MRRAEAASRECDLFIVLGSSLLVYRAAALPMVAKSNGAALATIDREPTGMDGRADLIIHAEIAAVLRKMVPCGALRSSPHNLRVDGIPKRCGACHDNCMSHLSSLLFVAATDGAAR
jgi:thiamine pyrophosphate-dependent acetolactate synthase large subunit-like protein